MEIRLSNKTRLQLGLKPMDALWQIHRVNKDIFYYKDLVLHKAIRYTDDEKGSIYIEYDTSVKLDHDLQMISARGKTKALSIINIVQESKKEARLTVNLSEKSLFTECGVKWLPELTYTSLETLEDDISTQINELYGKPAWGHKVNLLLKTPKLRQTYKASDVFCIRLGANKYAYALLIGSFMKLRKMDFWPARGSGHLFSMLMTVPIVLRKYNFVTHRNDLSVDEVIQNKLLNPQIIMDDALLRGEYKIIGKKKLEENDISFPMHYSCYGRHSGSGLTSALGLGVFDKENVGYEKERLESILPYYKCINIIFTWGLGYVELDLKDFLKNEKSDTEFRDAAGIGGLYGSLAEDGSLVNPLTVFEPEKVRCILETMGVDPSIDFDEFNKKYNGLTRKEYIDKIN